MTDEIEWMEGEYVGALSEGELRIFQKAVNEGKARRSYEGAGGFMGLAKVRLTKHNAESRP